MRGNPHAAHVVGDLFDVAHRAVLCDRSHQLLGVEAALFGELHELGVDVWHLHVGLPAHESDGEERLDAARATGDHGDRTRRGYRGYGRVADPVATRLVARTLVVGHNAALLGEGPALLPGLIIHELHYLLGEGEALFRVVGDAELYEEIRKAHDPEPNTSVPPAHRVDLVQGVVVLLDDIVQKADRRVYRLPQVVPVDVSGILAVEAFQVDAPQVARVIRRQMRLRAWVRRLYRELRCRVVVVDLVYEHDARLAVEMRTLDDLPEQVPGANGLHYRSVAGIGKLEVGVRLDGLHELVGYGHGDVEVVDLVVVLLAGDELLYVGVVHPEDAHVRPTPGPALLDLVRRSVVDGHERDRTARHAHGRLHQVVLGTQTREAEARAAAALVDDRLVLEGVVDAVYGVLDRQHEARGKLLQLPARVHEGRRVRHEPPAEHHLEEPLLRLLVEPLGLLALFETEFALRDVRRNPQEHLDGLLCRLALLVLFEVALPENGARVLGEFYVCKPVTVYLHTHPLYSTARCSYSIIGFPRVAQDNAGQFSTCRCPSPSRRDARARCGTGPRPCTACTRRRTAGKRPCPSS